MMRDSATDIQTSKRRNFHIYKICRIVGFYLTDSVISRLLVMGSNQTRLIAFGTIIIFVIIFRLNNIPKSLFKKTFL